MRGGMREEKLLRVVGVGAALPLLPEAPDDPRNRRIAIIVLNKATEAAIKREGGIASERPRTNRELFAAPQQPPANAAAELPVESAPDAAAEVSPAHAGASGDAAAHTQTEPTIEHEVEPAPPASASHE